MLPEPLREKGGRENEKPKGVNTVRIVSDGYASGAEARRTLKHIIH